MYRMDCMRYHNSDHKCLSSHFLRDFYLSKEFCVISREALLMKLSQKMIRLKLAPEFECLYNVIFELCQFSIVT